MCKQMSKIETWFMLKYGSLENVWSAKRLNKLTEPEIAMYDEYQALFRKQLWDDPTYYKNKLSKTL